MPNLQVLVVDDAAVIRRLVAREIAADPELELAGTAANGRIALAMMEQVQPDVVILDVEMPELDGLATLKVLREKYPRVPVIMFSSLTQRGAEATLDALALGAADYFAKPENLGGAQASLEVIRNELIPEIKALGASVRSREGARFAPAKPLTAASSQPMRKSEKPGPIQVVAIGTSTGGPNALAEVFRALPSDFPVPILIVQHMPPLFTRLLAERLSARSGIEVREAAPGTKLAPGQGWIAPGDYHMIAVRNGAAVNLQLHQDPPENSCRPAVDVTLRSVARSFGQNSLTVILTGMGQDGLRGCQAIRETGGQILAQDEATSVVWGMPGSVARAGLADRVLPISLVADEIVNRVRQSGAVAP